MVIKVWTPVEGPLFCLPQCLLQRTTRMVKGLNWIQRIRLRRIEDDPEIYCLGENGIMLIK